MRFNRGDLQERQQIPSEFFRIYFFFQFCPSNLSLSSRAAINSGIKGAGMAGTGPRPLLVASPGGELTSPVGSPPPVSPLYR